MSIAEALDATVESQFIAVETVEIPQVEPTETEFVYDVNENPYALMERLLNSQQLLVPTMEYGKVVEGVVMHKSRDEILLNVGTKSEGVVSLREMQSLSADEISKLNIGDTMLVFVLHPENDEGQPVLSLDRARLEKVWRRLSEQFDANEMVEGEIYGTNKGGLLVSVDGVRGFIPSSQVSGISNTSDTAKQNDMSRYVNTTVKLKLLEVDRSRNRLIMSERQAAQEHREAQKERLMSNLTEGQIIEGVVRTVVDFGAFVDIGGADGLIHLSELSWNRVTHPGDILKPNDVVKVFILSIDETKRKVALSLKRTQPEPWTQIATNYQPGQLLEGTITQITNFGAFARIADGVEGLIHISELSEERVNHPSDVVNVGDAVSVRLLSVDPQRRRLSLSLKKAVESDGSEESADDTAAEESAPTE